MSGAWDTPFSLAAREDEMFISLTAGGHCIHSIVRHRASPYSYTLWASRELARFPSIRNEHILPRRPLPGSPLITVQLLPLLTSFLNWCEASRDQVKAAEPPVSC